MDVSMKIIYALIRKTSFVEHNLHIIPLIGSSNRRNESQPANIHWGKHGIGRWKEVLTQTAFRCTVHSDQYNLVKVLGVILGVRMDLDVLLVDYF